MSPIRDYLRRQAGRPLVRPLALVGPIVVLLVTLPLLRPLRHASDVSQDEALRLATIRALVDHRTLAINRTLPAIGDVGGDLTGTVRRGDRLYSAQPPMMALMLAPPGWVMTRVVGLSFDDNVALIAYMLTLLGATLPVALSAGLVYRMGRMFELRRPWRAALGLAVVFGSGLVSYAVVLNPHAPAAALVLWSAACLIHVNRVERAGRRWGALLFAGLLAGLASTIDPPAAVLALLFMFVIAATRFHIGFRTIGVVLYLLGVAIPVVIHAQWNAPITGDWLPASLHAQTGRGLMPISVGGGVTTPSADGAAEAEPPDDLADSTSWGALGRSLRWLAEALFGAHGVLSHFPVMLVGVAGVFAVMHRHWPPSIKVLAAATLVGACTIVLMYCVWRTDWRDAMFAARWFVVFLPLLLFWTGAWVRRGHKPVTWTFASALLAFSVTVSLIGAAAGPFPTEPFRGYTAASAAKRMLTAHSADPEIRLTSTDPR